MFKEEYNRLLQMLENCLNMDKVNLEDILKESVVFFETLRQEFPKASKDERDEMIQMMNHLHNKLQEVSKKTAEKAGMSEEDLSAYAENPSNFTPEQWEVVQASKRQLYDSARKFSSDLEEKKRGQATEGEQPKKKPIKSRTRRSKRSDWKKS